MNNISVSIIIVSWNVGALLRECLDSIYKTIGLLSDQFEIIVVDNDSNDESVAMVRTCFPDVKVIANKNNSGFGAANNQAAKQCRGKFLLLLNPDTVVPDRGIDRLLEHMNDCRNAAAMGCRLINADQSFQRWTGGSFPTLWNVACHYLFLGRILPGKFRPQALYLDEDVDDDVQVDWVSGACMMLRKEFLGSFIFDEAYFMYGEDMELCYRLKNAGHEIVYTPVVSIIHYQGASMAKQTGDVLLSSLKGPRRFFQMQGRGSQLVFFDLLTLTGFFLRWLIYGVARIFKAEYKARARSSLAYMNRAARVMIAGREK